LITSEDMRLLANANVALGRLEKYVGADTEDTIEPLYLVIQAYTDLIMSDEEHLRSGRCLILGPDRVGAMVDELLAMGAVVQPGPGVSTDPAAVEPVEGNGTKGTDGTYESGGKKLRTCSWCKERLPRSAFAGSPKSKTCDHCRANPPAEKTCRRCGSSKPLDDFHNSKVGLYRRASECKPCRKATAAARWKAKQDAKAAAGPSAGLGAGCAQDAGHDEGPIEFVESVAVARNLTPDPSPEKRGAGDPARRYVDGAGRVYYVDHRRVGDAMSGYAAWSRDSDGSNVAHCPEITKNRNLGLTIAAGYLRNHAKEWGWKVEE
jgi:hypothetical protein